MDHHDLVREGQRQQVSAGRLLLLEGAVGGYPVGVLAGRAGLDEQRVEGRIPMLPLTWGEESMFVDGVEGITPTLIGDTGDRYWDVLAWRLAADR